MSINWSNDSSVFQVRPSGHKFVQSVDIDTSGATSHTITGIPSDAAEVCVHLLRHSLDGSSSGQCNLRLGNGSIDSGNYYTWATCDGANTTQQGNSTNKFELMTSNHTSSAHRISGTIRLVRSTHSEGRDYSGWVLTALLGDHNNNLFFTTSGFYGTTGAIDRINLFNSGGYGYDVNGRLMVTYQTGNY
tara:strand:+ start:1003 stop:1569 length:567 start_codon:yes stop_codon:yes gene_type:complete